MYTMWTGKAALSPTMMYSLEAARTRVARSMLAILCCSLSVLEDKLLARVVETRRCRKLVLEAISVKLRYCRLNSSKVVMEDTIVRYPCCWLRRREVAGGARLRGLLEGL
jgi:hypothetical protein